MRAPVAVLLHNVRSAQNVGAIFRTAEAAGAAKIYLTGYTPAPEDRFGRPRSDLAKAALGAERFLSWEHRASAAPLIARLHREGWRIAGVEQDPRSRDYRSFSLRGPTLFIFGNEVRGLSQPLREACDTLLEIPMRGRKESLNVAVAAGIVLFTALRSIHPNT